MKKMITLLLAALMAFSMLVSCGGTSNDSTKKADTTENADGSEQTTEAPYEAVMVLIVANDNWPHLEQVMERIKEITLRDINISLKAIPMTFGTQGQQIPLMLAGKEQLDIFMQWTPIDYYEQAYIIDMMPYWDTLKDVIAVFGEDEVKASLRDGKLLGFFPRMERTHNYGMAMRTDMLNAVGYTEEDLEVGNFDQATEIFEAVHKAYPEMTVIGGSYNTETPAVNLNHTHILGDNFGCLDNYGSSFEVTNFFESDYFVKCCHYAKQWFDAGYIQKDISTSQDSYESLVKAGNTFGGCCPMKPDSKAEKDDQCGHDMTIFHFNEDMVMAYDGQGYAIGGTSKDPAQAARLMNYIFTSREFNDTVNWGIEGVDWVETDDESKNVAYYPEGMTAENQTYHNSFGWIYPNQRCAHVWKGNDPVMYTEIYPAAEEKAHRSVAYGFNFDDSPWMDNIAALNNIVSEHWYVIGAGAVDDVDASIEEFNKKLYDSGLQDIMDAKQKALDEWRAENGK